MRHAPVVHKQGQNTALTKQLKVVLRSPASSFADASHSGGLLQYLDLVGVQLKLSHAIHHGHELLDTNLTLLI